MSRAQLQAYGLVSVLLLVPLGFFILSHDGLSGLLRLSAPEGQQFYLASKAFGLCALVVLCWQMLSALIGKYKQSAQPYSAGKRLHVVLGSTLLALVVLHVSSFVTAASLRSGHLALKVLLPNFTAGYYTTAVSLGVIALLLISIAAIAAFLRKKLPVWRASHAMVFVAVVLVFFHVYLIGSEVRADYLLPVFWLAVGSVLLVSALRIIRLLGSSGSIATEPE